MSIAAQSCEAVSIILPPPAGEGADVDGSITLRELRNIAERDPNTTVADIITLLQRRPKAWIKEIDVDFVHLKYDGTRWHGRFADPQTGKDVKRQLPKTWHREEALEWAREQNERIRHGRALLPSLREPLASRQPKGFRVEEAFKYVLDTHSNAKGVSRSNLETEIGLFLGWLSHHHPEITHWVQIERDVWQQYDKDVKERREALLGYRNAFKPLRMASKHLAKHRDGIYADELSNAGLKPSGRKPRRCSLTIKQVIALLLWAKQNAPHLTVPFAIIALAGKRITEVLALRWRDVDLSYPLIAVTDVPESNGMEGHEVKTDESERRTPICSQLAAILREYSSECGAAMHQDSAFLLSPAGEPWTKKKMQAYIGDRIEKIRRDLKHVEDFPQKFTMRHLRTTFNNLARFEAEIDRPALVAYLGRNPEDVTALSYEMYTVPQKEKLVVRKWEAYLETYWNIGNLGPFRHPVVEPV